MSNPISRVAIIGAGVSGLVALAALREAGHDATIFERADRVGGQWNSVYDSVHLLSAKSATQFSGFPMPKDYPDFPSGEQFRSYISAYAEETGLEEAIRFNSEVVSLDPVDGGMGGWSVTVRGQLPEHFDAVVVANGHLVEPRVPTRYPGTFTGTQFHTAQYRSSAQLVGDTVLVVGSGNSACDMAIDSVNARKKVLFSVRNGTWFLPATFFGRPRNEITFMRRLPGWLAKRVNMWMVLVSTGRPERYGLPTPAEDDFNKVPPTISSLLPYWIQRGRISVVPEIRNFDGKNVTFVDGTTHEVDTLIWATGYEVRLPFMPEPLITWIDGKPARLVGGLLSPDAANLYYSGLASPRGGSPHNYGIGARTIARMVTAQAQLASPLSQIAFADERPSGRMDYLLADWTRLLAAADRRLDEVVARSKPSVPAWSPFDS